MTPKFQFLMVVVALVAVNLVAGLTWGADLRWRPGAWGMSILLFYWALVIIGRRLAGDSRGVLLDKWNAISLSRFQLALWTTLVTTGVLTAGIANIVAGSSDPFSLGIPDQLWMLLGISGASAVGAPFILDQPNRAVTTKETPAWADILYGDVGDSAARVDMSKVQQFFFTVIVVAVYGIKLVCIMASQVQVTFPPIDNGFVVLLAISHAAYLTHKATQS